MCGIAGFIAPLPQEALESRMRPVLSTMVRRGPDSDGIHHWPGVVLGHRRLAILDLSVSGHQPMVSDDGQVGIVFNGCIYNFWELRRQLEQCGQNFRSQCDTEVLLRGYLAWGLDKLLPLLRGMFAFSIWDQRKKTLYMVRDRLGVKPLLYTANGNSIAFASTVTALQQTGLVGEVDPKAVLDLLEFGWVSDRNTILAGCSKVQAGTVVEWREGTIRSRTYWTLPQETRTISFEEAVEETEALLLESVRLRLISDVPMGALLSGGIDSSLICWAVSKLNANLKTFTVGTGGDASDESEGAIQTARALQIPHEVIQLAPGDEPELQDLFNAFGEPFACSSALGMLRVCKAVRPEATVLLTGDGGDDVFLGYPHYRHFLLAQNLANKIPAAFARNWPLLRKAIPPLGPLRRAVHLMDYSTGGLAAITGVHDGLPYYQQFGMLGPRLQNISLADRQIVPSLQSARNLLPEFLEYERRTRFVAEYMTKVDGASTFHSIEARSPLLDQHLWEFASTIPFSVRLRGGELKAVLRALARKRLGPEIADRRKQGFTIPVARWLPTVWKPQLERLLENPILEQQGWLQRGSLRPAVQKAIAGQRAPEQLWFLVVLEEWLRNHSSKNGLS
jgi:asparagine synthase (glutamine-hydrolysing)